MPDRRCLGDNISYSAGRIFVWCRVAKNGIGSLYRLLDDDIGGYVTLSAATG